MKAILILEGGLIIDCKLDDEAKAADLQIEVRDYDTEGRDEEYIRKDEYGTEYYPDFWGYVPEEF